MAAGYPARAFSAVPVQVFERVEDDGAPVPGAPGGEVGRQRGELGPPRRPGPRPATACHPQTLRQMRWTNTLIKTHSPQLLASAP